MENPITGPDRPRFLVKAGTQCAITPITTICWRGHTTKKDCGFERYETWDFDSGCYTFRDGHWLMKVKQKSVLCRNPEDLKSGRNYFKATKPRYSTFNTTILGRNGKGASRRRR